MLKSKMEMPIIKIENLAKKLRDLHGGKIGEQEALEEVKKATPLELSMAEQKLLKEGLSEPELKEFCKVHLKAVEEKVEGIKSRLDEDHPLYVLISEHDEIQGFLEELEKLGESIKGEIGHDEKMKLHEIAENLVEAEKHHEREEEVLFPRLEDKGIDGPPRIMKMNHEKLRSRKKKLLDLSKDPEKNREEVLKLIDFLVFNLRDHIFKENNVLYPTALDEIEDWDVMKEEGEKIGYCSFASLPSRGSKSDPKDVRNNHEEN